MFNWVHTKFHYNPLKDKNELKKKNESRRKDSNKKGVGKQIDEIVDVLDDDLKINNNGMSRLTIFFMGYERSSKVKPINNYIAEYFNLKKNVANNRDEIVDDDDDELIPLMATTFHNNFDDSGEFCTEFEKSRVVVAIERHVARRFRPRVTLAELFTADHANVIKVKPASAKGATQDFPTKLLETVDDDDSCFADKTKVAAQPPVRNIRRVIMRKMRKKKIHVEVDEEQLLGEKGLISNDKLYGNFF